MNAFNYLMFSIDTRVTRMCSYSIYNNDDYYINLNQMGNFYFVIFYRNTSSFLFLKARIILGLVLADPLPTGYHTCAFRFVNEGSSEEF